MGGGVILLGSFSTAAQDTRYSLEYDAKAETVFHILNGSDMATWHPHDYVDVLPYTLDTRVKKTVSTDNDVTTLTIFEKDTRRQAWMTQPKATISDRDGIVMLVEALAQHDALTLNQPPTHPNLYSFSLNIKYKHKPDRTETMSDGVSVAI